MPAVKDDSPPAKYWAVVPAAGAGTRMQAEVPKQYLPLAGRPVIEHTLHRLAMYTDIAGIMVALAADDELWAELRLGFVAKRVYTTTGGAERCHSVLAALNALKDKARDNDWVLVHDAARPCVRPADLDALVSTVRRHPAGGILAMPVRDTMKRTAPNGEISETVDREHLWHALTPQMFPYGLLREALASAIDQNALVTDEASAVERAGHRPLVVEGHSDNIKITRPEDLELAAFHLQRQAEFGIGLITNGMDDGG
jgi:2-C-methyl-D-erythritol 4-phosphate cytidylyltransferase